MAGEETRIRLDQEAGRLLRERTRIGLWLIAITNILFAIADLKLQPGQVLRLFLLKLIALLVVAAAFDLLDRVRSRRGVVGVALAALTVAYGLSAVSGIVTQDIVTTPILCSVVALGSATLLPWGVLTQLLSIVISCAAILWNAELVTGSLWSAFGYPAVGVAIAFGVSIYIAYEWERYREAVMQEVLERERAEEELSLSLRQVENIMATVPNVIYTLDLHARLVRWNRQLELITGFASSDLMGRSALDFVPEEERKTVLEAVRRALETGKVEVEGHLYCKDGRAIPYLWTAVPLRNSQGETVGITGAGLDITDRQRAEAVVRESEERYRALVESASDAIYTHDFEGNITSFNRAAELMTGYSREQALGMKITELLSPRHAALVEEELARVRAGELLPAAHVPPGIEEREIVTRDGRTVVVEVLAQPLFREGRAVAIEGVARDVTERKRAAETAALLASIVESSDDAIIGRTLDGKVVSWNAGAERMFGYTAEEVRGQELKIVLPPEREDELPEMFERIRKGERIRHFETVRVRRNGEHFDVSLTMSPIHDAAGNIIGVSTIARDITERKRSEAALQRAHAELEQRVLERTRELTRSNELLRQEISERQKAEANLIAAREAAEQSSVQFFAVLNTVGEGIVTIDDNGAIIMMNPEAEKIWGYPREEVSGRNVQILMPVEYRAAHSAGLRRYLQTGHGPILGRRIELEGLKKDGTRFPLEIAVAETRIGQRVLFTAAVRDISDRKRAEAELQQTKEAAEAATRAKSKFLASMSHEIRTPMNAVIGMTGLLLDTELTPEQQEYAETIRRSGEAMLTLINGILDFSKIESDRIELEKQPFDLRSCTEEALDLVAQKAAEKGLELAYVFEEDTPDTIVGDLGRLRQILVNLLDNAVKFTTSGEVFVLVKAHRLLEDRHQIHFSVRDTGVGIAPDRREHIFESFSQAEASVSRQFGGTGLGLAISKRLSELMGGAMWVESEPGTGSTFHFTIVADAAPVQSRVYPRGIPPLLAGKRVLIVEDNATNRDILCRQTQAWGMLPRACSSGHEALTWILRGDFFDVAIVDMHMPGMDGMRLASELRRHRDVASLPLILLTAVGRRGAIAAVTDSRGSPEYAAFLVKPIKPYQLYEVLVSVLEGQPGGAKRATARAQIDRRLAERLPLRILLAEDTEVSQKVALRILERMGYRADLAANGLEVLQALSRQPYDVVLMDVRMPEMDGLEATRKITERWPKGQRPRIIAMTAYAMQEDRDECLAAGMDDYLSKPVQFDELQAALERCGTGGTAPVRAPTAAPAYNRDSVDRSVFAKLRAGQEEGESDLVTELIEIFVKTAPGRIARLREAAAQRNCEALHEVAHRLKSGCAQLGAVRMAGICADLERKGRAGNTEGIDALVTELGAEYERVVQILDGERRPPPGEFVQ